MEEAFINRTKIEKVRMAKESQLSLKGGMGRTEKDGTCNTIIGSFTRSWKENCWASGTSVKPVQVPLFDESGESVEDKGKRERRKPEQQQQPRKQRKRRSCEKPLART